MSAEEAETGKAQHRQDDGDAGGTVVDMDEDFDAYNDAVTVTSPSPAKVVTIVEPTPTRTGGDLALENNDSIVERPDREQDDDDDGSGTGRMPTQLPPGTSPRSAAVHNAAPGVSYSNWVETKKGFLTVVIAVALFAVFPLAFADNVRPIDFFVFACFVPTVLVFLLANKFWNHIVSPRKLFGEWAIGFICLVMIVFTCGIMLMIMCIAIVIIVLGLLGVGHFGVLVEIVLALVFPVVEETCKYLLATRRYTADSLAHPKEYVLMPLMAALGLATGESFNIALFIRKLVDLGHRVAAKERGGSNDQHHGGNSTDTLSNITLSPAMLAHTLVPTPAPPVGDDDDEAQMSGLLFFFIIVCCCIVFMPAHALSGYYIGLGVAKRRVQDLPMSTFRILAVPIAFRFLFFYFLFFLPHRTYGISLIFLIPMLVGFTIVVKKVESSMPQDYLSRTGYLNAWGYGVIGSGDAAVDDEVELGDDETGVAHQVDPDVERANDFNNTNLAAPPVVHQQMASNDSRISISKISI